MSIFNVVVDYDVSNFLPPVFVETSMILLTRFLK